ncbi:MAG: conjugal transfer protein TraX [Rickettsiaceae bacterium]|nr:conjugal transfer protein TraX [Rickettsiaceae bacterium]
MNSSIISKNNNIECNVQDVLKLIAIIGMIFDHVAMAFYPKFVELRLPGRISIPLFCFFAGYNLSSHIRYLILFWGMMLTAAFYFLFNKIFINLLVGIFLGKILLLHIQKPRSLVYIHLAWLALATLIFLPSSYYFEASSIPLLFMIVGWLKKNNKQFNLYLFASFILYYYVSVIIWPEFLYGYKMIIIMMELGITFILLNLNFKQPVSFNCRVLSRNLLSVYIGHLTIIFLILIYIHLT